MPPLFKIKNMGITEKQLQAMITKLQRAKERKKIMKKRISERKRALREKTANELNKIIYPDWFRPYKSKYRRYLTFDIKKNLTIIDYSFEEFKDVIENSECHYCGIKEGIGLDRIDNTKGHTKDNTVAACGRCNMTRGNWWSYQQMIKIGKVLRTLL